MTHAEQLERRRERYRARYATDPEFRARELAKGREWSLANPSKRAARKRRWRAANPERAREQERTSSALRRRDPAVREDARRRTAAWTAAHPEARRVTVLARHGMTVDEYEALLIAQGGVCAICSQPERMSIRGRRIRLAVDHHHGSGRRRGLLCSACNLGIGSFSEDVERLAAAIEYLAPTREQEEAA